MPHRGRPFFRVLIVSLLACALICDMANMPSDAQPKGKVKQPGAAAAPALYDDSLNILLARHADRSKIKSMLETEIGAKVRKDDHVNREDYSILNVQPQPGKRDSTRTNILNKHDPNILAIQYNWRIHPCQSAPSPPNDPCFPGQWALADMNWVAAQAAYQSNQQRSVRLTIL